MTAHCELLLKKTRNLREKKIKWLIVKFSQWGKENANPDSLNLKPLLLTAACASSNMP